MKTHLLFFVFIIFINENVAQDSSGLNTVANKTKSIFARGIFNVIQFPNTGCPGTNGRNGTCYTSDECTSRAGSAEGTCANGYGVCCVVKIDCGQSSSENCTYLILGPTTSPPRSCVFTLCQANNNICRMRLDFTAFEINGPIVGTTVDAATDLGLNGAGIGDCTVDSFVLATPGNKGSPVICGTNKDQHIYVDTADACSKASFMFGPTTFNRQIDIKVTQYACNEEAGGPNDCLQYLSAETGTIKSFNFRTVGGFVDAQTTHLSNQLYDICFRRSSGKCALCFSPTVTGPAIALVPNMQSSFGLSVDNAAIAVGQVDTLCTSDYLVIPNGQDSTAASLTTGFNGRGKDRFCGRFLDSTNTNDYLTVANRRTICTARRPFRITFRTDADEATDGTTNPGPPIKVMTDAIFDEQAAKQSGTVGFSLDYFQVACP